jgi:glycosidase
VLNRVMRKVALLVISTLLMVFGVTTLSNAAVQTTVVIHYQPAAGNTDDWSLWIWEPGAQGATRNFDGTDAFGKVATLEFDHVVTDLGFIVKVGSFSKKDGTIDRSIRNFVGGRAEVWVKGGVSTVFQTDPSIVLPKPVMPSWAKDASIYEVNLRQFSSSSSKFAAVQSALPRLKRLGVKILWLMPLHPISVEGRKGTLGSPYAVQNYLEVNPEYGTLADLKSLVNAAHAQGFHVIMDWVANHTGLDNVWTVEHPEWYTLVNGVIQPNVDWTDVADLDFSNSEMRTEMIDAMKYWVTEVGIDGYRCDFSGGVPTSFWNEASAELRALKPLFMLSENDSDFSQLDSAFVSNYGWNLMSAMNSFASSGGTNMDLYPALARIKSQYPGGTFPMTFITNHDENSWNGTEYERLGAYVRRFSALSFTLPGMPLIYNGQEIGLNRRLEFFENDPISWKTTATSTALTEFYRKLVALKTKNAALWNGSYGGALTIRDGSNPFVLSYSRAKGTSKVIVSINLSSKTQKNKISIGNSMAGYYYDFATGKKVKLASSLTVTVPANGFVIYSTTQVK